MFRLRKAVVTAASRKKIHNSKQGRKLRKRKKSESKDSRAISECVGFAISLGERKLNNARTPIRRGCSSRCRHAGHLKDMILCSSHGKTDDWISEDMYKHFTETDSRPLTPENYSRRSITLPRSSSMTLDKTRKCVTPEPDTKQCQFHNRRVLILDLRRVKSVDAITRQNSLTTGESVDSTYGDFDYDNRSSSVNRGSSSIFPHSTPRNFSLSRSTSPKGIKGKKGLTKKKDRTGSPIAYERSSSPKILEGLTLPPLHQSVLTLLGQKSGVKSSPRNLIAEHGAALDSANANKAKKLRRHGRKKKAKDDGKESEEKELEKPEAPDGRGDNEELQETQLSTFQNQNGENDCNEENDSSVKSPSYLSQIKSLRDILDGHLRREQWSQKEMENLNEEIERLSDGLRKHHTDFKAKSISIKEDTWLAFPRTCTRVSATFGVPWNSKQLRDLEPVDYLRNYVMITEPRLHLYNLVYQRYRMLENPMGTTITIKSLQRALTEVLGRQFTDEEMLELQKSYLNINASYELDSKAFAGICAFCERIYGKYELERCSECAVCSRSKVTDKERCHVKRKNELEEIDLSYLFSKIKLGEASPILRRVITGLTKTELIF